MDIISYAVQLASEILDMDVQVRAITLLANRGVIELICWSLGGGGWTKIEEIWRIVTGSAFVFITKGRVLNSHCNTCQQM